MKTCFASVIYKQAQPYFQDFITSLEQQSDQDFDLLLVNDNLETIPELPSNAKVVDVSDKHLSIAQTRIKMLRSAKEMGYDLIILGDADDIFPPNRVEAVKRAAELDKNAVIFYNKLITNTDVTVFKILPEKVDDIRQISQGNFLGLTSTAINLSKVSMEFIDSLAEGDTPVFDWYLFTRLLMDVGVGKQVEDTFTTYRIYNENEVGLSRDISKEYRVKETHYTNLAKRYDYFRYLLDQLKNVDLEKIHTNPEHQGYWWSDIQMEDSYEI